MHRCQGSMCYWNGVISNKRLHWGATTTTLHLYFDSSAVDCNKANYM